MSNSEFVHSVKVPHLYKVSSKIVKTILHEGGSLKELLYTNVRANIKGAYALIIKTLERNADLEYIITSSNILSENPKLDPCLAKVLVAELLFGKGTLQGACKPVQTVVSYTSSLQSAAEESRLSSKEKLPAEVDKKPRYVRVNTLRKTCDEVIKVLRAEGWEFIPAPDTYDQFLQAAKYLNEYEFMRDFHLKDLLVFPPRTEFFQHEMYRDGTIILQDKASCLPPYLLSPEKQSTVLDMCAAPGMKTTMLAALMRGKGSVYAVEINSRRVKTLESIVEATGCENVTVIEGDSLQQTPDTAAWCAQVEYILVDPTCSGTGMTERARLFTYDKNQDVQLRKMTGFQKRLLTNALTKFPAARRVVYSTCSMQEEENEDVVSKVLAGFPTPAPWKVVLAMPEWPSRGSDNFDFGKYCVTASPSKDLTTGFFIAVLERVDGIPIDSHCHFSADNVVLSKKAKRKEKKKKWKVKKKEVAEKNEEGAKMEIEDNTESEICTDMRTKHEQGIETDDVDIALEIKQSNDVDDTKCNSELEKVKKKKKRKTSNDIKDGKNFESSSNDVLDERADEPSSGIHDGTKKKKHKKERETVEGNIEEFNENDEGRPQRLKKRKKSNTNMVSEIALNLQEPEVVTSSRKKRKKDKEFI